MSRLNKARYRAVKIQPQWVVTPGKQTNNPRGLRGINYATVAHLKYEIFVLYIKIYYCPIFPTFGPTDNNNTVRNEISSTLKRNILI
jgi:hypothetical protein